MNFEFKILLMLLFSLVMEVNADNLGHRLGGDVYGAENTLYSYKKAIKYLHDKKNFKNVEFDVQETKDSELILFHDKTIKRVIPKSKYNLNVLKRVLEKKKFDKIEIKDLTLKETSQLLLEYKASIPTLEDVLKLSVKWKVHKPLHIEIKQLHSDKGRYKLIKTVSKYNKLLDVSFIAFQKYFYKSFPDTERWIALFQQHHLKFYQIGKHEFTKERRIESFQNFKVLLPESKFRIYKEKKRKNSFDFEIKDGVKKNDYIKIGIYHAYDNSGDMGITFFLNTQKGKRLMNGFSNSRGWEWFKFSIKDRKKITLTIEDKDTSLKGKSPGNGGIVKVLLVTDNEN